MKKFFVFATIYPILLGLILWNIQPKPDLNTWYEGEEEIDWNKKRLPLRVTYDPNIRVYLPEIEDSIYSFNRQIGCPLFTLVRPEDNLGDVLIILVDEPSTTHFLLNWKLIRGGKQFGIVTTTLDNFKLELMHGLGHVIGLADDSVNNSIMNYKIKLPTISSNDRSAIFNRYCLR